MKKISNLNRTKHGAASVFLAIIMAALILVECTFLAFVWNLDRAMAINTALKTEIDTILSDYNRQLYSVYGVYAFTMEGVDDECFSKALEINGLTADSELFVSGRKRFKAEDLKKAINSFYWYRGTGIALKTVARNYSEMVRELDKTGIINKAGKFMQSPAAGYLAKIIGGTESAEEWIKKAGDTLNIDDLAKEAADMDAISKDYKNAIKDFGIDINLNIENFEAFLKTMSKLEKTFSLLTDNSDAAFTKFSVSHYCAYNFDCHCRPKGDTSINGADFKAIHGKSKADSEYIITGMDQVPAVLEIEYFMYHVLLISCILNDYINEKFRNTMEVLGQVISAIILAVSEGSVDIDPRLIAAALTFCCAAFQTIPLFIKLTHGDRAVLLKYEDEKLITFNYRDILYLAALCAPTDTLLERMTKVLERDYGKLYKGIKIETDFRGSTYSLEKSYSLYG